MGLIPTGGYIGNVNYINKDIMSLLYREKIDGCTIRYARNGGEYRPPEFPKMIVDGFCAETRKV